MLWVGSGLAGGEGLVRMQVVFMIPPSDRAGAAAFVRFFTSGHFSGVRGAFTRAAALSTRRTHEGARPICLSVWRCTHCAQQAGSRTPGRSPIYTRVGKRAWQPCGQLSNGNGRLRACMTRKKVRTSEPLHPLNRGSLLVFMNMNTEKLTIRIHYS